jgi:hypothetical protein
MKGQIGTIPRLTVLALIGTACVAAPATSPSPTGRSPSADPSEPSPTEPPVADLSATLDDEGCRLEGELVIDPGPVSITVNNKDPVDRGSFQLLRILESGTFDELVAHVAEEQTRISAGEDPIGFPAYATEVVGALIVAGTQDQLEATLQAGIYAMVCADWADGGGAGSDGNHPAQGGRVLVAGPLTVGAAVSRAEPAEETPGLRGYYDMTTLTPGLGCAMAHSSSAPSATLANG